MYGKWCLMKSIQCGKSLKKVAFYIQSAPFGKKQEMAQLCHFFCGKSCTCFEGFSTAISSGCQQKNVEKTLHKRSGSSLNEGCVSFFFKLPSRKLTFSPLKMGRNPKGNEKVFQSSIFRCENLSFREGTNIETY